MKKDYCGKTGHYSVITLSSNDAGLKLIKKNVADWRCMSLTWNVALKKHLAAKEK